MSFMYDGKDAPTHVVVVIGGLRPSVRLGGRNSGWSIAQVDDPSVALRSAKEAEAAGAHHRLAGGAEVFLRGTAPGGKRGTIAVAQPPCGYPNQIGFVNQGVGYSQLLGGRQGPESVCPGVYLANDDGYYAMTDFSRGATQWVLEGAVAGSTSSMGTTRFLIIDLTAGMRDAFRR